MWPSVTAELSTYCEKLSTCLLMLSILTFDFEISTQEKPYVLFLALSVLRW